MPSCMQMKSRIVLLPPMEFSMEILVNKFPNLKREALKQISLLNFQIFHLEKKETFFRVEKSKQNP